MRPKYRQTKICGKTKWVLYWRTLYFTVWRLYLLTIATRLIPLVKFPCHFLLLLGVHIFLRGDINTSIPSDRKFSSNFSFLRLRNLSSFVFENTRHISANHAPHFSPSGVFLFGSKFACPKKSNPGVTSPVIAFQRTFATFSYKMPSP